MMIRRNALIAVVLLISMAVCATIFAFELQKENVPVIVNGDTVEFFTEQEKVVAEGNVVVEYGETTLTCDKIVVFTKTKDGIAEGNVVLRDEKGAIRGESLSYNFQSQEGKIVDADFKMAPYFILSSEAEKFSEKFILRNADITTCNLDKPHYRMHCRKVEIFPADKIRAKGVQFIVGSVPILYLPIYVQSLKDRRHGFSFQPGQSKEWGTYLLTAYRYYLNEEVRGLLRLDYRENKGFAYGFDLEKFDGDYGTAYLRYYFLKESLHGRGEVEPFFKKSERYKVEYRHRWDIDQKTQLMTEIHDFSDENFLRTYFNRQYEINPTPKSYLTLNHSYPNAALSLLLQKRFNQFFTETEKIPEVKLDVRKFELGSSSIYYKNDTSITGFTSRTRLSDVDEDTVRADTFNRLSYPFKLAFFNIEPNVGIRYSYYSKDKNGSEHLFRSAFSSGVSILTKLYRIFDNVKMNAFGIEIDKLRHIITPSLSYGYVNEPTLPNYRLTAFDSIDSLGKSNGMTLSLENKLQTKREDASVNFLRFIVSRPWTFEGQKARFGDVTTLDLEMKPNSWLQFDSNAAFDHRRRSFRTANFDVIVPFKDGKGKMSAGYRYSSGGDDSELMTFTFERELNPKWRFRTYHRVQFTASKLIEEQEYALTRDLHCWELEFIVNGKKKKGTTFWIAFRSKVFPDIGFEAAKHHQAPKNP